MDKLFKIENLSFKWKESNSYLFNNINFDIEKNRLTSIIGKNGSGKTTLLKLLSRILDPTNGKIILDEKDISTISLKELATNISYVEQNLSNDIPLLVKEVVSLGNILLNDPIFNYNTDKNRQKEQFERAIFLTKIESLIDKPFNRLSGGEKQKVLIARAICQSTKIILLDEPTSFLDIKNQFETMELLDSFVKKEGMSVILISHNLNLVSNYSDNILIIKDGIVYSDTKELLLKNEYLDKTFDTKIEQYNIGNKKIFFC